MSSRIAVIARESIQVHNRLAIPVEEIEFRYSRSSGPGGQHAQKTETRVEAVFDVDASETLSEAQKSRLRRSEPACGWSGSDGRRGRAPRRASGGSRRRKDGARRSACAARRTNRDV